MINENFDFYKMIHFKEEIRFHLKNLFTHFLVFLHQWFDCH